MINKNKYECSGCSACVSICAKSAIKMHPDKLGFLYPEVDTDLCVDCGMCEKVCDFHANYDLKNNLSEPILYAARQKDINQVQQSRSGGIFPALGDIILSKGGVIYGAGFDDGFRVVHNRAVSGVQRDEMRGSKYVQSDVSGIFPQVEKDLNNGVYVLFSGTPCQVAGLKRFLELRRVDCSNLLTCDIVCHGVPSPYVWRDYIKYIEKKYRSQVIKANFRDKRFGWKAHIESFELKNKKYISSDTYTNAFYKHIMFRHSCGNCPFTNFHRVGDITLADYWGIESIDKSINSDDLGVSLIMINSIKGMRYFNCICDQLNYIETTQDKCSQPNLIHPSLIDNRRNEFEEYFSLHGFKKTMEKFVFMGWKYNLNLTLLKIKMKCWHIKNNLMKLVD